MRARARSQERRHPGESRGPAALISNRKIGTRGPWIPAYAGMTINKNRIVISIVNLAFILCLVPGCGLKEVRFSVTAEPKVILPGVRKLAILHFADPRHQQAYGASFANALAETFQSNSGFMIISPATAEETLAPLRLFPSQFANPQVVAEAGRRLGAEALLFGDVQTAEVKTTEDQDTVTKKVGERHVLQPETLPSGETRMVSHAYPIYHEFRNRKLYRVGRFQTEARVVRAADGSLLWQQQAAVERKSQAEEAEAGEQSGDWSPDEAFMQVILRQAAQQLGRDLLPRVLPRVRVLAEAPSQDAYAGLIRQGIDLALQGDWQAAGGRWLQAAALAPERPEARADLGVLRERSGELAQARNDYAAAAVKLGSPWKDYAAEVDMLLERK
jgi:hypothetical protein